MRSMRLRTQIGVPIAALALAVAPAIMTATPASAQLGAVCASAGTGNCLAGGVGTIVRMQAFSGGANQLLNEFFKTVTCNGFTTHFVSSAHSCPFDAGTGLNAQFNGDAIVTFNYDEEPGCIGTSGFQKTVHIDCTGSNAHGTIWVQDGNTYVNRADSNSQNSAAWLISGGAINNPAFTDIFKSPSHWGVRTG